MWIGRKAPDTKPPPSSLCGGTAFWSGPALLSQILNSLQPVWGGWESGERGL